MAGLCMNCMQPLGEGQAETPENLCPHCGWDNATKQPAYALPYNTLLQDRYRIGRTLSLNGEGITYVALDEESHSLARIREFFPESISTRAEDGHMVAPLPEHDALYAEYLDEFLLNTRRVARLRELAPIVSIYDIFEENKTAYSVSEWVDSISLRQYIESSGGRVDWNTARQLFMPLLTALSAMSSAGVHHLAISPETIRVMPDGKMQLGDFCCESVHRKGTALKPDLHPGCAAFEQYADQRCGEYTDVYGFTASLLYALTGTLPKNAMLRRKDARLLISSQILKTIPPHVISAIANALQVMPEDRTATFERLRAELSAAPTVTASIETMEIKKRLPAAYQNIPEDKGLPPIFWMLGSCILTLCVILVAALILRNVDLSSSSTSSAPSDVSNVSSEVSSDVSGGSEVSGQSGVSSQETSQVMIKVPNLLNENYEEWLAKTRDGSLQFTIRVSAQEYNDSIEEGNIISQSPNSGTDIAAGSTITVVVSRGPQMRPLPVVENTTLAAATELLSNSGFNTVKVDAYSDTVPYGYVIGYESASAGDLCEAGSNVTIVLSKGPDRTQGEQN